MLGLWLRNAGVGLVVTAITLIVACSGSNNATIHDGDDDGGLATTAANPDGGKEGTVCATNTQCASGTCTAGRCTDSSCNDGKKDGTETGVDCGGVCAACGDGSGCVQASDCTSSSCDPMTETCLAPTATDGVKNGSETDVDCGDSGSGEKDNAPPCADGKACKAGVDCVDAMCGTNDVCLSISCSDKMKDGNETALDCGGSCNPCADHLACAVNADCTSKVCDVTGTHLCLPPTSTDKVQNGNETDVDCGSSGTGEATNAPPCGDSLKCTVGTDCIDTICGANGTCSPATCNDGHKDGTETGSDCGGACAGCADGIACAVGGDCTSKECDATTHVCDAPTSTDKVQNGTETDVDCGDSGTGEEDHAPPCADGLMCKVGSDCTDLVCGTNGTCLAASCSDKLKNGNETDTDCGGSCMGCADTLGCKVDADCTSKSCNGTKCLAPTSTDRIQNGNETDVDCGSSGTGEATMAPACADTLKCGVGADCVDLVCTANKCAAPSCTDGVKNGHETDKDCGGGTASGCGACADSLGCKVGADCTSLSCNGTKCLAPTDTDKIKNGNETDVDCGSGGTGEKTNAPACATGKDCVSHADCVADGCNYLGVCIAEPSCAQHSGGDTCGAGETDQVGQNHESCCASITLPAPNAATRLDKYEITAGRMREFVNRTGGNISAFWTAYLKANPASVAAGQIRSQDTGLLPTGNNTPYISTFKWNDQPAGAVVQETGLALGLYRHIGATVIFSDEPSDLQGCYVGKSGSGSYGHPTYWWDDMTMEQQFGGGPRAFTQAQLDEKSLNCVTEMMLVAFCAWDGGHLASSAELNAAWGSTAYPWGDSPAYTDTWTTTVPGRKNEVWDSGNGKGDVTTNPDYWTVNMPANNGTDGLTSVNLLAPTYTPTNWNPFYPTLPSSLRYYWPYIPGDAWGVQVDEAYEIAAPGRFIHDMAPPNAATGWFDLAANMIEATSTLTGNDDDADRDGLPLVYWNGGSFEGHGVGKNTFTENILTKYGKVGGRCAR